METTKKDKTQDTEQDKEQDMNFDDYIFLPPLNPLEPYTSIVVGPCRNGMPCSHCFSFDNGANFHREYAHDIYPLIEHLVPEDVKSTLNFKHIKAAYNVNKMLHYKKFKRIKMPSSPDQ